MAKAAKAQKSNDRLAAQKYARKLIVKNGLPDYECVGDAIVTDFLAGVAWARRQERKRDKAKN